MPPIIGISVNTEQRQLGTQALPYTYLNEAYAQAIVKAGGIPLLIPSVDPQLAQAYATIIDGLLLAGGEDVDPGYYGETCLAATKPAFAHKDASDFALVHAVASQQKPIFGICRGFQVLNIAFGGTLIQDVSLLAKMKGSHVDLQSPLIGQHHVQLQAGSRLAQLFGSSLRVNSLHHQTLGVVANPFMATARSHDGLVEGIEHQTLPIFGVQWHPELLALGSEQSTAALFHYFVQELCATKKPNLF